MIGVDHIADPMVREKFKELDRLLGETQASISLLVTNMEISVSGGPVIFEQASEPPIPTTGTAIWKKTQKSGPTIIYISAQATGGKTWLWLGETI